MSTDQSTRPVPARDQRTELVVAALADHGLLVPGRDAEATSVVDGVLATHANVAGPTGSLKRRFAELAGYLGAAFVISAAGIFFAAQWPDLTPGQRIGTLAGVAVLLAVFGFTVARTGPGLRAMRAGRETIQRRLAGVLFIGTALAAGGAVGILVDESTAPMSVLPVLAGFASFTVLCLLGYLLAPSVTGQAALAVGLWATVPLFLDQVGDTEPVTWSLITVGMGVAWLVLAERSIWREVAPARGIGCLLALVGAHIAVFDYDHRWSGYLLLVLLAAAAFGVYVGRTAWPYLATGVIAVTSAVPQALLDWTDGAVGPAGVLLAAGVTLLGASLLGLRLRKEATDSS